MAIAAVAISDYLSAFWGQAHEPLVQIATVAAAFAFVAWQNVRGLSAEQIAGIRRLSLLGIVVLAGGSRDRACPVLRRRRAHRVGRSSVSTPSWQSAFFAIGGRHDRDDRRRGGVRPRGRGARRPTRAQARGDGQHRCRRRADRGGLGGGADGAAGPGRRDRARTSWLEAPLLGVVSALRARRAARAGPLRGRARARAALLLAAVNAPDARAVARLGYSLATNRQIPSAVGRLHPAPRHAVRGDRRGRRARLRARAARATSSSSPGCSPSAAMLALRRIAHLSMMRAALPRARPAERLPDAALDAGRAAAICRCPPAAGALLAVAGWVSVVVLHDGARIVGGALDGWSG